IMIRVFFDTSVLIAGLASKTGASHAVLMMAEIGLIQMVISQQVILECQRNLIKKVSLSLSIFEELLISVNP
ncbi:MAG TPA: PIN domain-containing protein, partial [Allocoleopsis sp.]